MPTQSRSTEALFMALANTEEATRAAREMARTTDSSATAQVDPVELITALRLIGDIIKQLGLTTHFYAQALNYTRFRQPFAIGAVAYNAARELHALSQRLRHRTSVRSSISAVDQLDAVLIAATKDKRRKSRRDPDPAA